MSSYRSAVLLGLMVVACGGANQRDTPNGTVAMAPVTCQSADGPLAAGTMASSITGSYRLMMVARTGPAAGDTARGSLMIEGAVGSATIPIESVGALRLGRLDLSNPAEPGVRVLQTDQPRHTIMLRLGSQANREGELRFDGGFTVLDVRRVDADGFAGIWRSGVNGNEASGGFCAVRN